MSVARGGYAWWYIDAISDDGQNGVTLIAFIGSVFSPYYAWAQEKDPLNHCALNVAIYGARKSCWAMTERNRASVKVERDAFQIGASRLRWDGGALVIDIDERSALFPSPIRGEIRVEPAFLTDAVFRIDAAGRHQWRPIAPFSRVTVAMTSPATTWTGRGYLDANQGEEPLEQAFRRWDWSRTASPGGRTVILYDIAPWSGDNHTLALAFDRNGALSELAPPSQAMLPATRVWRMPRTTRTEAQGSARILRTLEDTPFYSRSIIESRICGETVPAVHESFSGARFRSPVVKAMLAFRMPRRARDA